MDAAITIPGISRTFLTHLGVRGLEDDRYVVERFQAMADGDIRRSTPSSSSAPGRTTAPTTVGTRWPYVSPSPGSRSMRSRS